MSSKNQKALRRPSGAIARRSDHKKSLYESWLSNKSELSAKNYGYDMRDLAGWLDVDTPDTAVRYVCSLSGPEANRLAFEWLASLGERGYSRATINRRLAALKSVTKLGRMIGLIDWSIEIGQQTRGEAVRDTAGCGASGFEAIIEAMSHALPSSSGRSRARLLRDRAIIHLLYFAGLRRMEPLTASYPDDIRRHPSGSGYELKITGKARGDSEWVPIGEDAYRAIEDYLEVRGRDPGPLFPGRDPSRSIHTNTVNDIVRKRGAEAGVSLTPHSLRHAAITEVLEQTNGDVRTAQRFARHKNPAVTVEYDDARKNLAARGVEALGKRKRS